MVDPANHPDIEAHETTRGPSRRVLYPTVGDESDIVLHLAASIARAIDAKLVVGHVDVDPDEFSMDASRDAARTLLKAHSDPMVDVPLESHSLPGDSTLDAVTAAVDGETFDLVVLGHDLTEELEAALAERVDCDTVVVNVGETGDPVESVLAPVAGGPHADVALEVAGAIADANDATVELLHVLAADPSRSESEAARDLIESAVERLPAGVTVDSKLVEASDPVERIVAETDDFDVTVIGAPTKSRLRRLVFESNASKIAEDAQNTVLMARQN